MLLYVTFGLLPSVATGQCVRPQLIAYTTKQQSQDAIVINDREVLNILSFRILLLDEDGFFDDPSPWQTTTLGQRRRQVLREVLEDVWWTLPQLWPMVEDSTKVVLDLAAVRLSDLTTAGWAEPLFIVNNTLGATVADAAAHQMIVGGIDVRTDASPAYYHHGRISLNTSVPFDLNADACDPNKYSLYGVILHELLHVFGVASVIGNKCYDAEITFTTNVISRWDALYMNQTFQRISAFSCDGIRVTYPTDLFGACGATITSASIVQGFIPTHYSPNQNCVFDLSHFSPGIDSDYPVMLPTVDRGRFIRGLTQRDVVALRLLGYEIAGTYGTPNSGRQYELVPVNTIAVPVSRRDTIKVKYGTGSSVALVDLTQNDLNASTLECIVPESPGLRVTLNSTRDSITILATGDPTTTGWISQTWSYNGLLGGTQRIRIVYNDSTAPTQRCPPNQLCDGSFEDYSRIGNSDGDSASNVCGGPTQLRYWRKDFGSVDIYRYSDPLITDADNQDDDFFRWYSTPGGREGKTPLPFGMPETTDNLSYLGFITFNDAGDYVEGVSQDITISESSGGGTYTFAFVAYAWDRMPGYQLNAGIRFIITDTTECGWNACERSSLAVFDSLYILPQSNRWCQLRTKPVYLNNGVHRIRISGSNCLRPTPDFGQAINDYPYVDNLEMISRDGKWKTHVSPSVVCAGQPFTILSDFTPGADTPLTCATEVLKHGTNVRFDNMGAQGSCDSSDQSVRLEHTGRIEQNRMPCEVTLVRSVTFSDRRVVDTMVVVAPVNEPALAVAIEQLQRSQGGFSGRVRVKNLLSVPSTVTGTLTWANGYALKSSLIATDAQSGNQLSAAPQASNRSTFVPLTIALAANEVRFLNITGSYPPDSLHLEQQIRISFSGIGSQCELTGLATLLDGTVVLPDAFTGNVYPQPAIDYVRIETPLTAAEITSVHVYDDYGQMIKSIDNTLPIMANGQTVSFQMNTSDLMNGWYYAVVGTVPYRSRFLILR